MTNSGFTFTTSSIPFDEDYQPGDSTRLTTNFANLARGEARAENLRNTLRMIDNRFNALMHWDNPGGDRYALALRIVSAHLAITDGDPVGLPLIEMLATTVLDRQSGAWTDGMTGNSLSSYIRDYDFSIRLPDYQRRSSCGGAPEGFGELHGKLFRHFLASSAYRDQFGKPPVFCLSVSSREVYHRTTNSHPVLGVEYRCEHHSATDSYFAKMGLAVRYFMPPHAAAPLAFYHQGRLLDDYTHVELASTVATMETFQKIYRPEIYNANSVAAHDYRPSLTRQDYSLTRIAYDREERSRLAVAQGRFAEEHVIRPHGAMLEQWSATCGL